MDLRSSLCLVALAQSTAWHAPPSAHAHTFWSTLPAAPGIRTRSGEPLSSASRPAASAASVDVAIVGGGPCGLATALALQRADLGLSIAVFERDAYPFRPKGGSIQISKPGWAAIEAVDAATAATIRSTGTPVLQVRIRSLDGERSLAPLPLRAALGLASRVLRLLRRLGLPYGEISRTHLWHDVRSVLARRVESLCGEGTLRHGLDLTARAGASPEQEQVLAFTDAVDGGRVEVRARLVLACDGASSAVRALSSAPAVVAERDRLLIDEGKSVWRGLAPSIGCDGQATFYRGDGGQSALLFPAGADAGSCWTVIAESVAGRATDSEDARRRLAEFGLPARTAPALLEAIAASELVIENKLSVRDFELDWASGEPAVAYMGDAVRPQPRTPPRPP